MFYKKILFSLILILFISGQKNNENELNYWDVEIEYKNEKDNNTINPIGIIDFTRVKPVENKLHFEVYNEKWKPSISFEIYKKSDLDYCKKLSQKTIFFSSCVEPNVGGDLIVLQNYVFLNSNVCLNCVHSKTKRDYCRPVIEKIFLNLKINEKSSLEEILDKIKKKLKK